MNIFEQKVNLITSTIVAFLSAIFGDFWFLFTFLLILNLVDYITGILKSRYLKTENSSKGFVGIAKKVYIWILIFISFGIAVCFIEIGELLGISLVYTQAIGWFTLTYCIVNEIRSILENLIETDKGDLIPEWLIRGLEVAQDKINKKANSIIDKFDNESEDTNNG